MQLRTRFIDVAVIAGFALVLAISFLLIPRGTSAGEELAFTAASVLCGLCMFVYFGVRAVVERASISVALILFVVGLAVELGSFALLYQKDGVLCAVTTPTAAPGTVNVVYESRSDLRSCVLLSIDVWTAGGYGSVMARHSQGWLVATEQLVGYSYMAIYMAILITVLHQHVQQRPRQ